jgi:AcrR family transcriptional regulator
MVIPIAVNNDDLAKDEIVRAALRLYQKVGPTNVTMDDLAGASGRSRTSLYYYYKNRDEIFHAAMEKIAGEMATEIRQAVGRAETLPDKIFAFCQSKINASLGDWKKVLNDMWAAMSAEEQSRHVRAMATLHNKLIYHESMILNEILADAARRKEMRAISPGDQDMLVFLISSGIRGLRREIFELHDPHDMKAALQLLTDMVVKWLRR